MPQENKAALAIYGYNSDPGSGGAGNPDETYIAKINPEKFSFRRAVRFNEDENANTAGDAKQHEGYEGDTLTFDLIFDGTGIATQHTDVEQEIEDLLEVAYDYQGDTHEPRYLIVVWGNFGFKCKLQNITLDYTLFKSDGVPLRAKASLTLIGSINSEVEELKANKQSPDMTHIKTVRIGDTLPQLCKDVYRDPKYYIQVARHNNIINFRNLRLGSRIVFPPLEK
jgi:hypothetical protein